MKRGFVALVLIGLGLTSAQDQSTTTLTGRITDGKTGEALAFATVYVNATTRGTTTDARVGTDWRTCRSARSKSWLPTSGTRPFGGRFA
jgi:hypothetical protein